MNVKDFTPDEMVYLRLAMSRLVMSYEEFGTYSDIKNARDLCEKLNDYE